ncbi:MAG: hydroxyacid dehydrogenase [Thermomicrobiales bacterium]|jgi:D-3-phosphoglycerate dehydrogenase / 2-oxoglutarate reductase|nr:hydroxyacid dehydrogenase [Thermomicrobiales bacterium]MDF3041157.1 hydroxyacid dehydrogenase [Thermomicrobiales bacterium]
MATTMPSARNATTQDQFTVVVTSDRYGNETWGLELEQALVAEVTDINVRLVSRASVSEDDLIRAAQDADALLVSTREVVSRRVLENIPRVKVISRYGVGLDNVDLDAAADAGIVVTHYPGYCTSEVADHAMAMIMALNRRIVEQDRALREGAWVEHGPATRRILRGPVQPLREQTLGLVGFGRIGQAVAARAKPFNLTILAADPYIDPDVMVAAGVEPVSLEDLLRRSDIVTIHAPLTPETRGLINAETLALMKPSAVLVNTARGPIIDLPALAEALEEGKLAGAALDVVDPEPLPADAPFYRMPNVILTPHSAYYSERSVDVVRRETLLEALQVLRGKRPRTVANPAVLEKVTLAP